MENIRIFAELTAAFSGLLSAYYAYTLDKLTWIFSLISVLIYFGIFLPIELFGMAGLQLVFVGTTIYGFIRWHKQDNSRVSVLSKKQAISLYSLSVLALLLTLSNFELHTALDIIYTAGSLIAVILLVYKKVDSWIYWIFIDLVGITLFVSMGLYLTLLFHIILLYIATQGFFTWLNLYKQSF